MRDYLPDTRQDGASKFKESMVGVIGRPKVLTLEEVAQVLVDIGSLESLDDGKKVVERMTDYRVKFTDCEYFTLLKVLPKAGAKGKSALVRYKIQCGYEANNDGGCSADV